MINIFLCDDNPAVLAKYQTLLKTVAEKEQYQICIRNFQSADPLLFDLLEHPSHADLIFLDIKIGKADGLETAKKLRNAKCRAEIIFITMHQEYVFDSFDVEPFYYIMKQAVSTQKIEEIAVSVFRKIYHKKHDFFVCRTAASQKSIPIQSITHFSICGRVATVYYEDEAFEFYTSIKELEERLKPKGFARCNRSHIINLRFIDQINLTDIILKDGMSIPVGKAYLNSLKMMFSDFFLKSFSS